MIKKNMGQLRKQIWGENASVSPGQIHGLALQLFASGIIEPFLVSDDIAGRDKIMGKHVMVHLAKHTVNSGSQSYDDFIMNDDAMWAGFFLAD